MSHDSGRKSIALVVGPADFTYSNGLIKDLLEGFEPLGYSMHSHILRYDALSGVLHTDILEMIDPAELDGVVLSGSLANDLSQAALDAFVQSLAPLPVVSVSIRIAGTHGVLLDGVPGMRQLMDHLIRHHGYRRIAFIGGPVGHPEAEERKQVFLEEMERHGLAVDPRLVVNGNFQPFSGESAIARLLEIGQSQFEGVVVANDEMALAAINHLELRGIRVPEDLFVTGFDDFYPFRLTTVKQSIQVLGKEAALLMDKLVRGLPAPAELRVPSSLVVRHSCGCNSLDRSRAIMPQVLDPEEQAELRALLRRCTQDGRGAGSFESGVMDLALWMDVDKKRDSFAIWQTIVAFRAELEPGGDPEASQRYDSLVKEIVPILLNHHLRVDLKDQFGFIHETALIKNFIANLANLVGIEQACEVMTHDLPKLGIRFCAMALFDPPWTNRREATITFVMDEKRGRLREFEGRRLLSKDICPRECFPVGERHSHLMVEPLFSRNIYLGYLLLSVNAMGCRLSNSVSLHVAMTVRGIQLWQERDQSEKRLIESEKMAALGALVAGVSHEINTPVGVAITAASDLLSALNALTRSKAAGDLTERLFHEHTERARSDSELILRNLQRAAELVRCFKQVAVDQASEAVRVFDLGAYLSDVIESLQPLLNKNGHRCQLGCASGIVLEGPPGSIAQVITNLVSNSVVHGFGGESGGLIKISCGLIKISCGRRGNFATIEYEDNGRGMDAYTAAHMYEPFFSTRMGQGGSGLGMSVVYNHITVTWGGAIDCHTAPGAGTRFSVRLGLRSAGSREIEPPPG